MLLLGNDNQVINHIHADKLSSNIRISHLEDIDKPAAVDCWG